MSDGIMIAFLPEHYDLTPVQLPHMTLVYAGKTDDLTVTQINSLSKDAFSLSRVIQPFSLEVLGEEIFGDEERVKVLRFGLTPAIYHARALVERWNASEHDFNPHLTVGPEDTELTNVPRHIFFNRICAQVGNKTIETHLSI